MWRFDHGSHHRHKPAPEPQIKTKPRPKPPEVVDVRQARLRVMRAAHRAGGVINVRKREGGKYV